MCLNDFVETVQYKWINSKKAESIEVDGITKQKFRKRDVNTGNLRLSLYSKQKHVRPSTVLHTAPANNYEFVEYGKITTKTTFYDLSIEKRHQLYRVYYELIMYGRVHWTRRFYHQMFDTCLMTLTDMWKLTAGSLKRLEEFFTVYKQCYDDGMVTTPGSAWQRDDQFSYSM